MFQGSDKFRLIIGSFFDCLIEILILRQSKDALNY